MKLFPFLSLLSFFYLTASTQLNSTETRILIQSKANGYLLIEIQKDNTLHFEHSSILPLPNSSLRIHSTQMIHQNRFDLKEFKSSLDNLTFETSRLLVTIDKFALSVNVYDKRLGKVLTTFTPVEGGLGWTKEETKAIYGIAASFGDDCNISC